MYIPSGSALLRLLQLPLFLFAESDGQPGDLQTNNDLNNLANVSPYHNAPNVPGVSVDLPDDCSVDRVILMHRHGSRGPASEDKYIRQLVATLEKAQDKIQAASLPKEMEFLKKGYKDQLVPQNLTVVGRQQLFNHGVEFSLRYPSLSTDVIMSTTVQRVIDSAHFFAEGFFGLDAEERVDFLTTDDCLNPVDCQWLHSWEYCPKLPRSNASQASRSWQNKYIPRIIQRLNALIPGISFSPADIRGALNACPYDLAARNKSPWCDVFTADELRDFEYDVDLYLDTLTGHGGSTEEAGSLAGAIYVKKLIERLTDKAVDSESLYLDFAHDYTILFALATMGLNKDAQPLTPDAVRTDRKFRTSDQTPFAANMVWERFTCQTSFQGPQVRLVLNGATLPLANCEKLDKDKKYGSCSLDAFRQANEWSMKVEYGNAAWNATCGHP